MFQLKSSLNSNITDRSGRLSVYIRKGVGPKEVTMGVLPLKGHSSKDFLSRKTYNNLLLRNKVGLKT